MKIHILGASGSGTTSLGIELSKTLRINHYDSDDYFWERTEPPVRVIKEECERVRLLKYDISNCDSWILSGSSMGWGDFIIEQLDYVIYIYVDNEIRMKRLLLREIERYGDRISFGNDMYGTHIEFMNWARSYDTAGISIRSKVSHSEWLKKVKCKIIRIENMMSIEDEVKYCMKKMDSPSPSMAQANI
jgi:adenylate kinase family enzyme